MLLIIATASGEGDEGRRRCLHLTEVETERECFGVSFVSGVAAVETREQLMSAVSVPGLDRHHAQTGSGLLSLDVGAGVVAAAVSVGHVAQFLTAAAVLLAAEALPVDFAVAAVERAQ